MKARPDFLIIGAQKCGTSWLWEMLRRHPETDLRVRKELFFFSSAENYRKGFDSYLDIFAHLAPDKVKGEASTDYFHDHVLMDNLEPDTSLPTVPELVSAHLPDVRVFLILRDPVHRAVSAYYHHIRRRRFSPFLGIGEADRRHPKLRIVERGRYPAFLQAWREHFDPARMRCFVFEDDLLGDPTRVLRDVYHDLRIDASFSPRDMRFRRNQRWPWLSLLLNYYLGGLYGLPYRALRKTTVGPLLGSRGFVRMPTPSRSDIECLRECYLGEKEEVEGLLGRRLDNWHYGP